MRSSKFWVVDEAVVSDSDSREKRRREGEKKQGPKEKLECVDAQSDKKVFHTYDSGTIETVCRNHHTEKSVVHVERGVQHE